MELAWRRGKLGRGDGEPVRLSARQEARRPCEPAAVGSRDRGVHMGADHRLSELAYAALKLDLVEGALPPGRVRIPHLVTRYQAGATPVREAMLRLVGENLLVMPPEGGFEIPFLNELAVAHLYTMAQWTSLKAVAFSSDTPKVGTADDVYDPERRPPVEQLFEYLAVRTGNLYFVSQVQRLNEQMRRIRRAEDRILSGVEREFAALECQIERHERPALRRSLIAYHKRRLRHLPEIVGAIAAARQR